MSRAEVESQVVKCICGKWHVRRDQRNCATWVEAERVRNARPEVRLPRLISERDAWLSRPDEYLAFAAPGVDRAEVVAWLDREIALCAASAEVHA